MWQAQVEEALGVSKAGLVQANPKQNMRRPNAAGDAGNPGEVCRASGPLLPSASSPLSPWRLALPPPALPIVCIVPRLLEAQMMHSLRKQRSVLTHRMKNRLCIWLGPCLQLTYLERRGSS